MAAAGGGQALRVAVRDNQLKQRMSAARSTESRQWAQAVQGGLERRARRDRGLYVAVLAARDRELAAAAQNRAPARANPNPERAALAQEPDVAALLQMVADRERARLAVPPPPLVAVAGGETRGAAVAVAGAANAAPDDEAQRLLCEVSARVCVGCLV